ncbi:PREDICTED: uncharacterized protein LOC109586598 [Amphimedon queenslandica]|uniref:Uncharacterized protein n=1 Tax=Amphimedon queenslandica TaxID=400682 RepID=A0A1X7TQF1_AMPQE|nr:PREDICTED: uncharacterized protein LOC109586598 [Amphimedon queenslandica]|eukprot:XP_019858355.1 PREDICTED: uncharacterized protein LOC109586598 [Amphimedon queenslandica]
MQPVQEVYDDRAAVSRKEELIQTVLTDVKTHEVTIETNLADMLESRYVIKTDESANNNKETKRVTREGGKLLKQLQDKFDSVCESSLEAIDALESIQRITRSGGTES